MQGISPKVDQWFYFCSMQRNGCLSHLSRNRVFVERIQSAPTLWNPPQRQVQECTRPNESRQRVQDKKWTISSAEPFSRQTQVNQSSVRASFQVAQLIATSGRPFSDGEAFSRMILMKNPMRSRLTDEHLQQSDWLRQEWTLTCDFSLARSKPTVHTD